MKLTYAQRNTLIALARGIGTGRSCTNSTLNALQRRNLVHLDFVQHEHIANYRVERWSLTDAGREAVAPTLSRELERGGKS